MDLETLRHSCSHVLADAVQKLYPDVKLGIGPAIENGFYYDFDFKGAFTPEDLAKIEAKMTELVKAKLAFTHKDISKKEANDLFSKRGERYKLELIAELPGDTVTIYQHGDFVDLCRGPHVKHTGEIKAFKLLNVAGAYWKGDEKRGEQLQRIYGVAFASKQELDDHLKKLEEALNRDHRKLGTELDLFSTMEDYGAGLVLWHPKAGRIRNAIENFWREEHYKNGYDILYTPHIGRATLWETSGHLGFYKDSMYSPMNIDGQDYYLKPMNCPFHIMIYKSRQRSYKDLPLRWAELGTVYRYEKSGVLMGLLRVRGFTQDDAHIICTPEQIDSEILNVLRFSLHMWKSFGFKDIKAYLATRPKDAVGEPERWDQAITALRRAVETEKLPIEIDEGGGAFYGPKIDLKVKDALDREWQMTTIQFDFNMSERFDMTFIGADGQKHRPYMVHRALLGSIERFFGVLLEHYAGAFPLWLAPVQALAITISEAQALYAKGVVEKLKAAGIRAELDDRGEKLGMKIREAQLQKIPYMLVIGGKEAEAGKVAVRSRVKGDMGVVTVDEFIDLAMDEIRNRKSEV